MNKTTLDPLFESRVADAPFGELVGSPLRGRDIARRAGQPRSMNIRQIEKGFIELRPLNGFLLDAIDGLEVGLVKLVLGSGGNGGPCNDPD